MRALLITAFLGGAMLAPPKPSKLEALGHATEWLNSRPVAAGALRGKVVLVQFWTYSCVNWLRTMPWIRDWAEKYRNKGLVVIGVHSPEFGFEKQLPNVRWGAKHYRVDYPIAVDNDFAVWRAFGNEYWPALYLFDGEGNLRHRKFGEGGYEETERAIQKLLAEAGAAGIGRDLASVAPGGVEAQADWEAVQSPETYLGTDRGENRISSPAKLKLNQWALSGNWSVQGEPAVLTTADGRITYRFHARDLNLVMGPGAAGRPVRFQVLIDGQPPGTAHGVDVDEQGNGTVAEPRMYQLVRQPRTVTDRRFEIRFLDPGVEVFVFTFG